MVVLSLDLISNSFLLPIKFTVRKGLKIWVCKAPHFFLTMRQIGRPRRFPWVLFSFKMLWLFTLRWQPEQYQPTDHKHTPRHSLGVAGCRLCKKWK